jgi:hypothetical protein
MAEKDSTGLPSECIWEPFELVSCLPFSLLVRIGLEFIDHLKLFGSFPIQIDLFGQRSMPFEPKIVKNLD